MEKHDHYVNRHRGSEANIAPMYVYIAAMSIAFLHM